MNIVEQVVAPPSLTKLISEVYESSTVIDKVILVGGTDQMDDKMGVYVPDTKSIIIDILACMRNRQWADKGMAFVPNAWCNLIYTVYHEGIHAEQYESFGEDIFAIERNDLEYDAEVRALEATIGWFGVNKSTPPLAELGWLGAQIQALFNKWYSQTPDAVSNEINLLGTEAGGLAISAAQSPALEENIQMLTLPQEYKDASGGARLLEAAERGDVGLKIKGTPYLRVGDILEIIANRNRS
jgi:hypothetical protein